MIKSDARVVPNDDRLTVSTLGLELSSALGVGSVMALVRRVKTILATAV